MLLSACSPGGTNGARAIGWGFRPSTVHCCPAACLGADTPEQPICKNERMGDTSDLQSLSDRHHSMELMWRGLSPYLGVCCTTELNAVQVNRPVIDVASFRIERKPS